MFIFHYRKKEFHPNEQSAARLKLRNLKQPRERDDPRDREVRQRDGEADRSAASTCHVHDALHPGRDVCSAWPIAGQLCHRYSTASSSDELLSAVRWPYGGSEHHAVAQDGAPVPGGAKPRQPGFGFSSAVSAATWRVRRCRYGQSAGAKSASSGRWTNFPVREWPDGCALRISTVAHPTACSQSHTAQGIPTVAPNGQLDPGRQSTVGFATLPATRWRSARRAQPATIDPRFLDIDRSTSSTPSCRPGAFRRPERIASENGTSAPGVRSRGWELPVHTAPYRHSAWRNGTGLGYTQERFHSQPSRDGLHSQIPALVQPLTRTLRLFAILFVSQSSFFLLECRARRMAFHRNQREGDKTDLRCGHIYHCS